MPCWVCIYSVFISKANTFLCECLSLHMHTSRLCVLKSHCFTYWQSVTQERLTGGNKNINYFGTRVRKIAEIQRSNLMLFHHLQKDFSQLVGTGSYRPWVSSCLCLSDRASCCSCWKAHFVSLQLQTALLRKKHESGTYKSFLWKTNFQKLVLFLSFDPLTLKISYNSIVIGNY